MSFITTYYESDSAFTDLLSTSFNGVDQRNDINGLLAPLSATTVGTWSIWLKPEDVSLLIIQTIISFGDANANTVFWLFMRSTGLLTMSVRSAVTKWDLRTTAAPLSDGTKVNVMLTMDGVSAIISLDGVDVAQVFVSSVDKTWWFNDESNFDNARLGAVNFVNLGESFFWFGLINDVIFINRALTLPQRVDIYNLGNPKDESGIANGVTYYLMGDGDTFPTILDKISSNNATMINMTPANFVAAP